MSAMPGDAAKKRATYEDVLAAPEHLVAEVLFGTLHTAPRPRARHARVSSKLGGKLDGPFDDGHNGPGGWIILDEPELHLGEDILVPDLAGWKKTRMPKVPDVTFFTLAPDWICEVVSPSTARVDRGEKVDVYAREGVRHAWLVDPEAKLLEVWRLTGDALPSTDARWLRIAAYRGDDRPRAEPFDAIELELASLWLED
jgi:Uma2 family endonuclease